MGEQTDRAVSGGEREEVPAEGLRSGGYGRRTLEEACAGAFAAGNCRHGDAARQALCTELLGIAAHISGDGCGGKRWSDQACDVGSESAGMPGLFVQAAVGGGTRSRLHVAMCGALAGARSDWNLQPIVLRRSVDYARASSGIGGAEDT